MLQDSKGFNFEKQRFANASIERIFADARRADRLPDLAGGRVYVAGASGKNTSKACEVQKFWLAQTNGQSFAKFINAGPEFSRDSLPFAALKVHN